MQKFQTLYWLLKPVSFLCVVHLAIFSNNSSVAMDSASGHPNDDEIRRIVRVQEHERDVIAQEKAIKKQQVDLEAQALARANQPNYGTNLDAEELIWTGGRWHMTNKKGTRVALECITKSLPTIGCLVFGSIFTFGSIAKESYPTTLFALIPGIITLVCAGSCCYASCKGS